MHRQTLTATDYILGCQMAGAFYHCQYGNKNPPHHFGVLRDRPQAFILLYIYLSITIEKYNSGSQ